MASAPQLEDLLTCPICQDTFTNPMVLKCHHTLCSGCLEALKRAGGMHWRVDCPICRQTSRSAEIQKDFRTITLLEAQTKRESDSKNTQQKKLIHTGGSSPSSSSGVLKLCELCNNEPVRSKCKQCNRLICTPCSETHRSIPACKNHTLHRLDSLMAQEKSKLAQIAKALREIDGKTAAKSQEMRLYQHNMDELESQSLDTINQWFEETVESIKQHKDMLRQRVTQAIKADKQDVIKVQAQLSNMHGEFHKGMDRIKALLEENDPAKVLDSNTDISKSLIGIMKTDTTKFTAPTILDMTINYGKKWDSSTALDIKVKRGELNRQTVAWTPFPSDFEVKVYNKKAEIKTEAGGKQVMFSSGYLWCLYHNRVDIHNKEGTWIDSVTDHLDNPNGMAPMANGNIVVACMGSGLIQLNSSGKYLTVISPGSFCDVTADAQYVYALDYTENKPSIKIFTKGFFKWGVVRNIELPYDNCNPCNTILCNGAHIFTTVATHSCLYRYHSSGVMLEKYEWPSASPSNQDHRPPRLCCADPQGQVIVAHFLQNAVWIFNTQRVWKQIHINELVNPYGVALDDEHALWMVNLTNNILKYT